MTWMGKVCVTLGSMARSLAIGSQGTLPGANTGWVAEGGNHLGINGPDHCLQ